MAFSRPKCRNDAPVKRTVQTIHVLTRNATATTGLLKDSEASPMRLLSGEPQTRDTP